MALETKIQATIVAGVDKSSFEKGVEYARDTGKKLDKELKAKLELDVANLQIQVDQARRILREAKLQGDKDSIIKAQLDINQLQSRLTEAKRQIANYVNTGDKDLSRLQAKFNSLGQGIKGAFSSIGSFFGIATLATAFASLTKEVVRLGSNLQQTKVAFESMLGSAQAADAMLRDLSEFAARSPFTIVGIRDTARQLLAMGVDASNLIGTMKILGDVAAGLSIPLDRLALAYGQVLAKGRLQGGELKQFTEAGVPIVKELAKSLGVAESEIANLVETGQISAVEVTKAFQKMTSEGGIFANLMEKQSKTFAGVLSNIQDNLTRMGEEVGTAILPQLQEVAEGIGAAVTTYGKALGQIAADFFVTLGEILGKAVQGIETVFNFLTMNTNKAAEDQVSFLQIVAGTFKAFIIGVKTIVKAISGVGAITGTALGVMFNNIEVYIFGVVNTGISALNKLSKAVNDVAGTSFKEIGLVGLGKQKLSFLTEMKNTVGEIADDFTDIDFSLGLEKSLLKARKLNTEIDLSKIIGTAKSGGKGGQSEEEKALKREQKEQEEFVERLAKKKAEREKELAKQREESFKKFKDNVTAAVDVIDNAIKDISKNIEHIGDEMDKVGKEINDINGDVAKRAIDLEKEIADNRKEMQAALESQDYDPDEVRSLNEKRMALEQELALARGNVSQEELQRVREEENKSETQKLLDKRTNLEEYRIQLQQELEIQLKIEEEFGAKKQLIQNFYFDKYGEQLQKEEDVLKSSVERRIGMYQDLARAAAQAAGAGGLPTANIPGRATGGPVAAGSPYIVGERGPELFVPKQSGVIVPNKTQNNNINVNANVSNGVDIDQLANVLARKISLAGKGIL